MTRRHSDVSNEEGSRTVGVEEGLNALTREKRDVKLQGDPRLLSTARNIPFAYPFVEMMDERLYREFYS